MPGISTFLDQSLMPVRTMEQKRFDEAVAYVFQNFPKWGTEVNGTLTAFNAAVASVNSLAAGGAYAIPFVFSTATLASDPGAGYMRLDNANGVNATQLLLSTSSAAQKAVNAFVQSAMQSSSAGKATVRISSLDGSRYIVYKATAITSPTPAYNVLAIQFVSTPGANFVSGETLMVFFQPTGDKGDLGISGFSNIVVLRSTQNWTAPAGVSKAEITVIDGGSAGPINTSGFGAGKGGSASIAIRSITPGGVYTATVGAGGTNQGAGGASSFSGSGLTTLTSSNGDLNVIGGTFGDSLYAATNANQLVGVGQSPGQGGAVNSGSGSWAGAAGAIIIRY